MARILAVEDEAELRDLLKEELESEGHEVVTASDGSDALARLTGFTPDIVVSDVSMPGIDGFGLLEKFRASYPAHADTPFLFLTALASREDELRAREHGIDDYLTKPVDFDILHSVLATRLRQVARMRERKEQQMVKLYTTLSGSAAPQDGSESVATAFTAPDNHALAEELNIKVDAGQGGEMSGTGEEEDASAASDPGSETAAGSSEAAQRRVFGSLFRFPHLRAATAPLPGGEGFLGRTIECTVKALTTLVRDEGMVSDTRNGDVIVAYRTEDESEARKLGAALKEELPARIAAQSREALATEFGLDEAAIENALVVSEALFEITLDRGVLSPEDFEQAVLEVIDNTRTNPRAPNLLAASVRNGEGHLMPLELYARDGSNLPIRFFNYDTTSTRKIRAGFAFFGENNREKAGYLVDVLTLDLMEGASRRIGPKEIAVIDVHFQTLASRIYSAAYIRKFLHFAEHTPCAFLLNVRSAPSGLAAEEFEAALRPLGRHANRRAIQITPSELETIATTNIPVSCLVCTYPELADFRSTRETFARHKSALAKAGTLLVLRGVSGVEQISALDRFGFDGYAVEPDNEA